MTNKKPWKREEIIGDCRLLLGDCLEIMPHLDKVDAVVTDPPYGIGFKYNTHVDDADEYPAFMSAVAKQATEITKSGGLLFFFQGMKNASRFHEWFPGGFKIFAAVRNFTQYLPTPVQHSWDPVIWWSNGKSARRAIAGQRDYHVGNTAKWIAQESNGHPCPRPLDTMEYLVRLSTDEGESILDSFMGSGTTGVACVKLGRRFIGIELDEGYFNIACERIRKAYAQPDMFIEQAKAENPTQAVLFTD